MTVRIRQIRNLGIIAHVDAGKTTLTERILYYCGAIHSMGGVDSGNTTTDSRQIEQQKGITITAAAVRCRWRSSILHLIDTPGHADFNIEVERSLRVLDGAVVLLDGVAGVEPQTEKVWRQADLHGVARVCFINKLDRPGASFERCLQSMKERLGAEPLVVALPVGQESSDLGLVDLIAWRELRWADDLGTDISVHPVRDEVRALAESYRNRLIDACADADPDFEASYLQSAQASVESFKRAIRRGTLDGRFVPTLGGSAYRNRGVQPLLDAVCEYLPSPEERSSVIDIETGRAISGAELVAYAFKVDFDRFGARTFVRVYEGELIKGAKVLSSRSGKSIRVGRVAHVFADSQEDVNKLVAGEIGVVMGTTLRTGETLSALDAPIRLEALSTPQPVVHLAIEPKGRADRDRLGSALEKLMIEDPSLDVRVSEDTGQTLLGGVGQLQLEVVIERLRSDLGVEVQAGKPKVAFRETVRDIVTHELKHAKQSGGPGQFAHLVIELGPAPRGAGLIFEDRIRGGVIAAEYIHGVRKGVEEAMASGALAGYPLTDIRVALLDGSQHSNDSSEMAFKVAASAALKEACLRAGPVLLEPLMKLEVLVSDDHVGDVLGDLGARRAKVQHMDKRGSTTVVEAQAPLAEMFGYADRLSTITHGRGQHTMALERYDAAPKDAVARLLAQK